MSTQFRDTQFGHLIRFLSSNKLFPYPNEISPSEWKQLVQQSTISTPISLDATAVVCTNEFLTQQASLQDATVNRNVEDSKDLYLVNWYGPDDLEVFIPS